MCNASLVLSQSYSLRHENIFLHPQLCLYCFAEAEMFLLSVQCPLMLEDVRILVTGVFILTVPL